VFTKAFARTLGWSVLVLSCLSTGCVVGPKYQPPTPQTPPAFKESPTQFKESGPWTVAQPQDAKIRGDWWEIFNESELNDLEKQLNINNQNIKQYFENFMEARALIREARSQYFPSIGTAPAYSRQRSANGAYANSNGTAVATNSASQLYSLPFDISWAPDLWGKVRNEVRQTQYAAQVSAADLENERLTEQASLAQYFFEIRGQDALVQLFAETIKADQKALDLTQAQYDTGIGDRISVIEAQNTLESAQSAATNLAILRAQYEHAIAVLVGQAASGFSIPKRPLLTAPPPIPIGMPSLLLERRPDVAAAERTMAEANATIGIAYAAYYPTLTISAAGGTETSVLKRLLDWPSRFWSIGPSLSETIYDGGLRRATVNQYVATYNADLASYRQTVLTAFQQVEDALAQVRILSQQIEQQRKVVASAQTALNLELGRYQTGVDPYIDVVTLQTTLLADQQALANLQVEEMTGAVQLVEALGGGWDKSQLPTPTQVAAKPKQADTQIQR
jgi:NodT family efflux transporter outer membrane factor (OMF) lipoprotein